MESLLGRQRLLRVAVGAFAALLLLTVMATAAKADPPEALPADATTATPGDIKWQPAMDYDVDGCYSTPAVGPDGVASGGLETSGALNGNCRDQSDLDNTNSYVRTKCDGDWCAHLYAYYFEKDQTVTGCCGHRHDLEHVIVWVENDEVRYVSASKHGGYDTRPVDEVRFEGSHPKIVYHKDGGFTHALRFAAEDDEPPENHYGEWQYRGLLSWEFLPSNVRDTLNTHDFGSATLDIKDDRYTGVLEDAVPEGVPFDPNS